jgi:hypothetical protein
MSQAADKNPPEPELTAHERRVVDLLHEARASTRAPVTLRASIEAERARYGKRAHARAWPLRPAYGAGLAGVLAAVVLAVVLVSPAGTPTAPSVSQAAALAALGPNAPAPAPDPSAPAAKLGRNVEDVYFPNWARLHWRAVGQRADLLKGRPTSTVYYSWRGLRVAYTIVGAPALNHPPATVSHRNGTELWTTTIDGRLVVTWHRAGHTCVLSGVGTNTSTLQALAAWKTAGLERS